MQYVCNIYKTKIIAYRIWPGHRIAHRSRGTTSGAANLTDKSITAIAANCPALTSLKPSYLTDEASKAIATNCSALTMLNVEVSTNLIDASIQAITEGYGTYLRT